MQTVTTIGLDIAKSVLQVHGVDAAGKVVNARTPLPAAGGRLPWCRISLSRRPTRPI